ncbi:MAG: SurA N-terminal domain-containing protein [Candidatus Omnitrophota bacterium]
MIRKAILLIAVAASLAAYPQELNKIAAMVNNKAITLKDLNAYSKKFPQYEDTPDFFDQILEHIVQKELMLQAAKKDGMRVSEAAVEDNLSELVSRYKTKEEFEKFLIAEGTNINILKEEIRDDIIVRQAIDYYVGSKIKVSPKEVTYYYDQHIDEYTSLTKYICWIAKSDNASYLESLSEDIKNKGFPAVISQTKDLFFKIESEEAGLKDELKDAVINIKEGEFRIKKIEGAYYLIYLEGIVPRYVKFLVEIKDDIHAILWKEKFELHFNKWMDELKSKSVIKIYE